MGGAHLERRVARISLNSNFELRHSCFVYLFVYFVLFYYHYFFLWLLLEQEHITFLGCVHLPPYLQERIVSLPEVFVVEGSEAIYFLCMFYQKHS